MKLLNRGLILSALLGSATSVMAETSDGKPEESWRFGLGAAVIHTPEYTGAKDSETRALPYFSINYGDTFAFSLFEGLNYTFFKSEHVTLGTGLELYFGRDEDDADRLKGLGDIDAAPLPRLSLALHADQITLSLEHINDVGDNAHEGATTEVGLGYKAVLGRGAFLTPKVSALYGNTDYAQSLFGITQSQSNNSVAGLPTFEADSGLISHSVELTGVYLFDRHWTGIGFARYKTLSSDIKKSPIVEDDTSVTLGLAIGYTF